MNKMMFSSNENIDYSQSTQKTFGSRKLFLLIMSVLAAVSDLALLIVFAISGHGGIAIPILLLILDGLFITGVCLSNFRFKYTIAIWVVYIAVSVIITSILAALESGGATYMTTTAKCLNVFSHLALYLVTIFASIYPLLKKNVKLKAVMVTSVAIAIVLMSAFAIFFSVNGYFGQGFLAENRVVGYTLDERSDTYIATSVKSGRSDKVIIPTEFNGKKVSGVNCSIFTYSSVKSVEIQSEEKINLVDTQLLVHINPSIKIGIDKKYIDEFRNVYLLVKTINDGYLRFSNNLYPLNLDSDERYVTFEYQDYPDKDDGIMPTWIGKVGQTFDFGFANLKYLQHTDAMSTDDLIWCFYNNDSQILTGEMVNLVGNQINDSVNNVKIEFENVYSVSISEDNDELYEPADSFKTSFSNDISYDYLYFTLGGADAFLNKLGEDLIEDRDNEFDLHWEYNFNLSANYYPNNSWYSINNLSDRFAELSEYRGDEVNIKLRPKWNLKSPTDLKVTFNKSSYVYGDDVNLSASAQAPNDNDYILEYRWIYYRSDNGVTDYRDGATYSIANATPQNGDIVMGVTVSSKTKTSLTSSDSVTYDLTVNKRPLHFTWATPSNMVYDGNEKVMQYTVGSGEVINGDNLASGLSEYNLRNTNAGKYNATLSLYGTIAQNYIIAMGSSLAYEIVPLEVEAQWTCGDYTYDGYSHNATATALGVNGVNVSVNMSSARTNAGNYTATATSGDSNYVLTNNTYPFEIKKKPVTVGAWNNATITYNGYAQYPTVSYVSGLVGNDNVSSQLIYSGYSSNINAGENYSVVVELSQSSNYKFDTVQSTQYNISKKALTVRPVVSNKTYDGAAVSLNFDANGLASVDSKNSLGTPVYSGSGVGAVNVGNYTVSISLPQNSVTRNYDITYTSASFTISKAQVALSWSNPVVSGNRVTPPSVITSGQVYSSDITIVRYTYRDSSGKVINSIPYASGTYSVEVTVTSGNYSFTNTSINFTVTVSQSQNREVA